MSYKIEETRSRDEHGRDWTHVRAVIPVPFAEDPCVIQVDVEHGADGRLEKRLAWARTFVAARAVAYIEHAQKIERELQERG